jgi:hypothetical protein
MALVAFVHHDWSLVSTTRLPSNSSTPAARAAATALQTSGRSMRKSSILLCHPSTSCFYFSIWLNKSNQCSRRYTWCAKGALQRPSGWLLHHGIILLLPASHLLFIWWFLFQIMDMLGPSLWDSWNSLGQSWVPQPLPHSGLSSRLSPPPCIPKCIYLLD